MVGKIVKKEPKHAPVDASSNANTICPYKTAMIQNKTKSKIHSGYPYLNPMTRLFVMDADSRRRIDDGNEQVNCSREYHNQPSKLVPLKPILK